MPFLACQYLQLRHRRRQWQREDSDKGLAKEQSNAGVVFDSDESDSDEPNSDESNSDESSSDGSGQSDDDEKEETEADSNDK